MSNRRPLHIILSDRIVSEKHYSYCRLNFLKNLYTKLDEGKGIDNRYKHSLRENGQGREAETSSRQFNENCSAESSSFLASTHAETT